MGSLFRLPQIPVAAAYVALKYTPKRSAGALWEGTPDSPPETRRDTCSQEQGTHPLQAFSNPLLHALPHSHMHTQRGLSGQGQRFSL